MKLTQFVIIESFSNLYFLVACVCERAAKMVNVDFQNKTGGGDFSISETKEQI